MMMVVAVVVVMTVRYENERLANGVTKPNKQQFNQLYFVVYIV